MNEQAIKEIFNQGLELMKKKNADYARKIDNIKATGLTGVCVRLFDKACRLISLTDGSKPKIEEESLKDTLIDAMNYAVIAISLLEGTWE